MPDQDYDLRGVQSGCAVVAGEELRLYYTGKADRQEREVSQCLAVSRDGRRFCKKGPVLATPPDCTQHFRDPLVLRESDRYLMLIGAQRQCGLGGIATATSKDGLEWLYQGVQAVSEEYQMVECPDLFKVNQQWVLTYCLQRRDNERDASLRSQAFWRRVAYDDFFLLPEEKEPLRLDADCEFLDAGFDFYAPQTMKLPDGRVLLWGWLSNMSGEQEEALGRGEPAVHCLSLPRELSFTGCLRQQPARELYRSLGAPDVWQAGQGRKELSGRAFCLSLAAEGSVEAEACLSFHGGEYQLRLMPEAGLISLQRQDWAGGGWESREAKVQKLWQVEIWADQSSVEIFINRGEKSMSARIYTTGNMPELAWTGMAGWVMSYREWRKEHE